jgi:hypothetical protein
MDHADKDSSFYPGDRGSSERRRSRDSQRSLGQASRSKEVTTPQNGDDRFLAALRCHGELDVAALDVERRSLRGTAGSSKRDFVSLSCITPLPARMGDSELHNVTHEDGSIVSSPARACLCNIAQPLLAYVQVSNSAGVASILNSGVSSSIASLLSSPSSCAATVLA